MVERFQRQMSGLVDAAASAKGRDAAVTQIREMVSQVRLEPKNGTLGILVKANADGARGRWLFAVK